MDTWTLDALVAELERSLVGWRVREARAYDGRRLELLGHRETRLVISCAPNAPALYLTRKTGAGGTAPGLPEGRPWPSGRLAPTRIARVERRGPDRIVHLVPEGRQGEPALRWVVELLPRGANALLLDASDRIVDVLRPVPGERSRTRRLLRGLVYTPPPGPGWRAMDAPDPAAFISAWRSVAATTVERALARLLPAAGKLLGRELAHRAGIGAQSPHGALADAAIERLYALAFEAYNRPRSVLGPPTVVLDEDGAPMAATILDLHHLPAERRRRAPSITEAVETLDVHLFQAATADRLGALRRARIRRAERAVGKIEADLCTAIDGQDLRAQAELLLAHVHEVERGVSEVRLPSFEDSAQSIRIALLPHLSPAENAAQLFKRHRKAQRAAPILRERLAKAKRTLEQARVVPVDASGVVPQTTAQRPAPTPRRKSARAAPRVSARRYRTSEGFLVLVGRNDAENDALSLRLAARHDLWFHAQGVPGSHVLLRIDSAKGEPSKRSITEAAALAAYWSKARGAKAAPVIYTEARRVEKPRKAPPGQVRVHRERTLFVEPGLLPQAPPETLEPEA